MSNTFGGINLRNFYLEVNLDNINYNINKIKEKTSKKIMAVVKADAYGLGIEKVTEFLSDKVDAFAVINMEEALKVKSEKDVLILTPELSREDIELIKDNFIITIDNEELLKKIASIIPEKEVRAHIYVDTGMNRFGVKPADFESFLQTVEKYKNIKVEGVYTHLNNTGDKDYTQKQISKFKNLILPYREKFKEIHILNSSGFLKYNDEVDFDTMVRCGNIIYGYDAQPFGYKKAYQYKARPIRVYEVEKGEFIGYGNIYKAKRKVRVGILDVGLIDSFDCTKNVRHNVFYDIAKVIYHHIKYYSGIFYNGRVIKMVGKPNMNFTIVEMDDIPEDAEFNIDLSPIYADSSIPKKYRKEDLNV